jgi:hypothetical protein
MSSELVLGGYLFWNQTPMVKGRLYTCEKMALKDRKTNSPITKNPTFCN